MIDKDWFLNWEQKESSKKNVLRSHVYLFIFFKYSFRIDISQKQKEHTWGDTCEGFNRYRDFRKSINFQMSQQARRYKEIAGTKIKASRASAFRQDKVEPSSATPLSRTRRCL